MKTKKSKIYSHDIFIVVLIISIAVFLLLVERIACNYFLVCFVNEGMFFGLIDNNLAALFTSTAIFFAIIFTAFIFRDFRLWCTVVMAGVAKNIADRIILGGVADYINFWRFPIFNIADVVIVVGVLMLIIQYIFLNKKSAWKKQSEF